MKTQVVYHFGSFRLNALEGTLWREDEELPLTPKACEVLTVLVQRSGQVVSRDELRAAVWGASTHIEANSLDRQISDVRKILGTHSAGQRYIETIPKRGYRFAASVQETALPLAMSEPADPAHRLTSGQRLMDRFEIIEHLGTGGMGEVYKARDHLYDYSVDDFEIVAIKTIRQDLSERADIRRRFIEEARLSHAVKHQNVIRMNEPLEDAGLTFVVLEYIDGRTLAKELEARGKFQPKAAVDVLLQAARAVEAAHSQKVIHRDLKPGNFMYSHDGRVVLMDFGLTRSSAQENRTVSLAAHGTPPYIEPAQLLNQEVDHRTDIYSLGIIFYELLTGNRPFGGANSGGVLAPTGREAPRANTVDPTVPRALAEIAAKCLAIRPEERYQTAGELIDALQGWLSARRIRKRRMVAALVILAAVAVGLALGITGRHMSSASVAQPAPVSIIVADFENKTGEPIFEGALEQMLTIALEDAPFIASLSRAQIYRVATELSSDSKRIDEDLARRIAVREGIMHVIAGSIAREGSQYAMQVRIVVPQSGNRIAEHVGKARTREQVLAGITRLAGPVRRDLGDPRPDPGDRAETFTAGSIDAMQAYALGQLRHLEGKYDEAARHYERAIVLDQKMGRAYTGLAVMYRNVNRRDDAVRVYKLALAHLDRMTEREKLRTRGGYYVTIGNPEKAIEEFTTLVERYPADSSGLANLALAHFQRREMKRAFELGQKAVKIFPKHVAQRNNVALYALYSGNFEVAEIEARAALKLNPIFEKALLAVALSQTARKRLDDAKLTYGQMQTLSARGKELAALGLADLAMIEKRPADAVRILDGSGSTPLIKAALAEACLAAGDGKRALSLASDAASNSTDHHVLVRSGMVLIQGRQFDRAENIGLYLSKDVEKERAASGFLLLGAAALAKGDNRAALDLLEKSREKADTWWGRLEMARASLAAKRFGEAHADLDNCERRRGEGLAMFLDDIPTAHYVATLEGLRSQTEQQLLIIDN